MGTTIKRIGLLTSGGDSPGMNPAIRAVVRRALMEGVKVTGIRNGYTGMVEKDFVEMDARNVGGIIDRGGTILGTSRCPEFMTEAGRELALANLREAGIDGLVLIGGNGSLTGGLCLEKMGMPVVGLPGSIDNDLVGTDVAIGVDTCLNTILGAMDKIRDTASSHHRAFIIEVMGRNCGYLALMSALMGGAEIVVTPEFSIKMEEVAEAINYSRNCGKIHAIIVLAEGAEIKANQLATFLTEKFQNGKTYETRVTILGHVQRGGSPSAFDRGLATRLGAEAVETLLAGRSGVMCGLVSGRLTETPLEEVISRLRPVDPEIFKLVKMMSI